MPTLVSAFLGRRFPESGFGPFAFLPGATGKTLLLLAAMVLPLSGCSRVAVRSHVDPDADFTRYRSYDLLPRGGQTSDPRDVPRRLRATLDPLYHAYVQEAVVEELALRGWIRADSHDDADLLIGYRTVIGDRAEVLPPMVGVGWRGHARVARPAQVRWYKEGTLVIDLVERRDQHLIWRGIGVGAMSDMQPGEELKDAVREILKELPR